MQDSVHPGRDVGDLLGADAVFHGVVVPFDGVSQVGHDAARPERERQRDDTVFRAVRHQYGDLAVGRMGLRGYVD